MISKFLDPNNDFHTLSARALEEIATFFEGSWPLADVDLVGETLTITLPQGRQYVIHKHGVTHQIWVASPFTGAHHFHMREGEWRCTRTAISLPDFLMRERNHHVT